MSTVRQSLHRGGGLTAEPPNPIYRFGGQFFGGRPSGHLTESDLQAGVLDIARMLGWRVAHFRPARTSRGWRTPVAADGAGFPDLLLIRGQRVVVAELKSSRGTLSEEQRAWLAAFEAAGIPAHCWRPADYPDRIAAALR